MKKLSIVAIMAIVLMSICAFASNTPQDIVDTAVRSGSFTLSKAMKAADLVDAVIDYHEAKMRRHELAEDPIGR